MNNSNCGQLGAIQTRGTCWFYSILNGFILSQDGQKILYNRLKEYYSKLKPAEKAYFDDTINAPCPLKDITKTKEIYFWKFIDQYLCFMSGPRAISLKAGKSANLLGGMSLQGTVAKEAQGARGAYPQVEIGKILDHVGFKGKYYMKYADDMKQFNHVRKPQFVVVSQSQTKPMTYMERFPRYLIADPSYEVMCASLVIANTNAAKSEMHSWHAIAGFVCNGKGYIYDSNQKKIFKCNWWIFEEFVRVTNDEVGQFYPFFKGGKINYHAYAFGIFARKEAIKDVAPACLLKTKVLKTPTFHGNLTSPTLGNRLNRGNYNGVYKPAQIAALKRKWARTEHKAAVYLNDAAYNSILAKATSRENAVGQMRNLQNAGYKVRNANFDKFARKMNVKFPFKNAGPSPKVLTFTNAKARLNQFTKSTAAVRKYQYSLVWKGIPMAQRKVLMHWRNKGEWLANNAFSKDKTPIKKKVPSPAPISPRTARATKVKTNFEAYWKALQPENRKIVRNYLAAHKSPSPVKPKSPSPVKSALSAAKRSVNAINSAKKRKEYRRKRAVNMSQNNWSELSKYIDKKNMEARWARTAKKSVAK